MSSRAVCPVAGDHDESTRSLVALVERSRAELDDAARACGLGPSGPDGAGATALADPTLYTSENLRRLADVAERIKCRISAHVLREEQ